MAVLNIEYRVFIILCLGQVQVEFNRAFGPAREQIETYLYQLTYKLMVDVVEEKAVGLRVSAEEKSFIADFYKYSLVGLMLDWIKKDMRDDPQELVNRLANLVHGNIVAALHHYDSKGR